MKKINEKEWRKICFKQIHDNGEMYRINTNHSFGLVHENEMYRFRKNTLESFSAKANVYVLLNGQPLKNIAEFPDSSYQNGESTPYYFLNSLHKAKKAISDFVETYSLKENDFFDIQVELEIERTCYIPYQNSPNKDIQLSRNTDVHYDYEEALLQNPENKSFQHWEKERNDFNFGTRSFKPFICFKSQSDGLIFTENKIDEIRDKLMKEFDAEMTPFKKQ